MSRYLTLRTGFVTLGVLTALWLLLYSHSVWRHLCGTASRGYACCPMYCKLTVSGGDFILLVLPIGWVVWIQLVSVVVTSRVVTRRVSDLLCFVIRDVELLLLYSGMHCVQKILWLSWSGVCYVLSGRLYTERTCHIVSQFIRYQFHVRSHLYKYCDPNI